MSESWPFKVHENEAFMKFIEKLKEKEIVNLKSDKNKSKQIIITDQKTLLDIFINIFLLYATYIEQNINFCTKNQRLVIRGKNINLIVSEASDKAKEILKILITNEDESVFEYAFNALIAVYVGSIQPLEFIYPNTYIVELGKSTHEMDIILGTSSKKCIIIETTRGFTKENENENESYIQHFKKSIFIKWMIEKLYDIECKLCYITLKELKQRSTHKLPEALNEETQDINSNNKLIDKILEHEGENIKIIALGKDVKQDLSINEISNLLKKEFIDEIKNILS